MTTAPGCAEYTAQLVNISNGSTQPIDLRLFKLSWERTTNTPANAVLTASDTVAQNPWCCEWELEEWCWELWIYRQGVRVAVYDYHSIFRNPETDSDVLFFVTRMGLVGRRWWWSDSSGTYEATDAFGRVLQEANVCDGLSLSRQPIPLGYTATVNGYKYTPLSNTLSQLTSGTLDYTEYSNDDDINVVRYGELCYEAGQTLIESDWASQPPGVGVDGLSQVSAVVVTSDIKGNADYTGVWPLTSDGDVDKSVHKRWLPLVIEVKDVGSDGEAADIARRQFLARASGKVIQSSGTSKLSETFPVCVDTLYPGAVFEVSLASGCSAAEGRYMLQKLVFDVEGGREITVKATLREKVD